NGTSEERSAGVLFVHCAAGDLQQLFPSQRSGRFLRRTRRDTTSGSCLQPRGAEPARARVRTEHDSADHTGRANAAADRAGSGASDGGAEWTGLNSDTESIVGPVSAEERRAAPRGCK